jgi:hypothetical protein
MLQRIVGYDEQLILRRDKGEPSLTGDFPSHWRVVCNQAEKCWICSRHVYSLLFWSERIGRLKNIQAVNAEIALKMIKPFPRMTDRPVIYSNNNRWEG